MVAAELDEPLVQRMRDEVMVVIGGGQGPVQVGLELDKSAHAAELEVAQPELVDGETRVEASAVEPVVGRVNHDAHLGRRQHAASTSVLAPDPAWQRRHEPSLSKAPDSRV